ncbi:MAG: TetR/AcrR family transcriptional regulator [Armatimonadetes bacterium]|nr:TetR/AcrR family transcriptional regulator [Armatimonadota bacterium]
MSDVVRKTRRDEQAEERREQLLEIALQLFGTIGMDGCSIKQLSHEAGVSQGLIYYYFKSKEDLLLAVVDRYSLLRPMRELLCANQERPAREFLPEMARELHKILEARRNLIWVFFRESRCNPAIQDKHAQMREEGTRLLAEYMEARIRAGELRPHDPRLSARALLSWIFMHHLVRPPDECFPPEFVDYLLTGILGGR